MDQTIRNKLRGVVTQCRKLLEEAVSQVLQGQFGISASGKKDEVQVEDESSLKLSSEDQQCRRDLVAHLGHIQALGYKAKDALAQLVREIAFTHLNRLCAYKMMEAREVWVGGQRFRECVSRGMKSQGFQFYLADDQHGEDKKLFDAGKQEVAYRHFLRWLGALLSEEIGVLFSPTDPANRLFPPQRTLDEVLALLNSEDLAGIWTEDETIGWVYQYFTPKELRDQVRKESAAPRNSYELAFRNQFFTPRYVVEFLTDNTLGRIWYEMRRGDTKLKDQCQYMVRRPNDVFLAEGDSPPEPPPNQEELSQEELLKQPVHIPHRPKKDPRELRILDPACGSGHFLLYCFDLLLTIYQEAYADSDLGPKLQEDYPTPEAFRRDVPRLILAHNLHGIDIDVRASQIAALALWLRCQRAFRELGLKQERSKITKSNFVCAEPMPGESEMLKEFVADLQPKVLGHLVEVVFDKMKLAGEAGSLLKVEEELRDAITQVRTQWVAEFERAKDRKGRPLLFSQGEMDRASKDHPQPQLFDFSEITDEQFWDEAESQVLIALRSYVTHASNGIALQRRLFADDAERGFAFIDLCQKRFDVVLMNPPFGDPSIPAKGYLLASYKICKDDIDAAFVHRGINLLSDAGFLGAIVNRTQFFKGVLQDWRTLDLLGECNIDAACDLGHGVLDGALVEAAAYILRKPNVPLGLSSFIRLLKELDKSAALMPVISALRSGTVHADSFAVPPSIFLQLPEKRISYWASRSFRSAFQRFKPLEGNHGFARQGLITGDNDRFVRLAWEVDESSIATDRAETRQANKCWVFYAKGGEYSPFFGDIHLVVNWHDDGREIQAFMGDNGRLASRPQNQQFYFRPGITYTERTASGFSPRVLPSGCIFDCKGPIISPATQENTLAILGIAMSRVFASFLEFSVASGDAAVSGSAARQYTQGIVGSVPVPEISKKARERLQTAVSAIWTAKCEDDSGSETSRYFVVPSVVDPTLRPGHSSFRECVFAAEERKEDRDLAVLAETLVIENTVREIYGLDDKAIQEIEEDFGVHPELFSKTGLTESEGRVFVDCYERPLEEVIDDEVESGGGNRVLTKKAYFANRQLELLSSKLQRHPKVLADYRRGKGILPISLFRQHVNEMFSYAAGCGIGRWDIGFATGARARPTQSTPFDSVPVRSPAMLEGQRNNGRTKEYPLETSHTGILPDDPDHSDDIVRRVREVLELIWKDRAETIENEALEILGVKELRDYFRKPGKGGFWDDHVARYSKSRRNAPIYWLLQSAKKNYGLWLYYHRLDKDVLFKARQNYVEPKIRLEQTRLDSMRSQKSSLGANAKGAKKIDKDIEKQEAFLDEVKDFAEKLERAAKLNFGNTEKLSSDVVYDPDLNDGVVLNIAPLWELVPWKEAKNQWEELLEGKYEWSSMGKLLRAKGLVK